MTHQSIHPDLVTMCESVEILSPERYSILGESRDYSAGNPAPIPAHRSATEESLPPMLGSMKNEMYARLYTRAVATHVSPGNVMAQRDHVRSLSMANTGVGTWEPGWKIVARERDGHLAVSRDNVTFYASRDDVRTRNNRRGPGTFCRVRVGKEIRQLMPGFYVAVGNGDERQRDKLGRLVRVYWNLTAGVAVEYVAHMTSLLNAKNVPFRTKVLNDPAGYVRADGGVLYVEHREFERARSAIVEVQRAIAPGLRTDVPMFTKKLSDGVGLAEDPGGLVSFGQSRVHLVALGLWSAFVEGKTAPAAQLEAVVAQFTARGLDPARPYLEAGSRDGYELDERRSAVLPGRAGRT